MLRFALLRQNRPLFRLLFGMALLAPLLVAPAPVAHAFNIFVDTQEDSSSSTNCSLRDAITAANTDTTVGGCEWTFNDEISFAESVSTITLTSPLPPITDNLKIDGDTDFDDNTRFVTISGDDKYRIFTVVSGTVELEELRIKDGRVVGSAGAPNATGGAMLISGGKVQIDGVLFRDNSVVGGPNGNAYGGAVYLGGGELTHSGVEYESNSAQGTGSGKGEGGAYYAVPGASVASPSEMAGNTAENGDGSDGLYPHHYPPFVDAYFTDSISRAPSSTTYTLTRSCGPKPCPGTTAVNLAFSGTAEHPRDYLPQGFTITNNAATLTIPAGSSFTQFELLATAAPPAERTIVVEIAPAGAASFYTTYANYGYAAEIKPYVALSSAGSLSRGPTNATFTFTRGLPYTDPLTASFTLGGSGVLNTDYTISNNAVLNGSSGSIRFEPGAGTAQLTVAPVAGRAAGQTVSVQLTPDTFSYSYGIRGTSTIALPILPGVTVVAGRNPTAAPNNGSFVVSRGASSSGALAVAFTLGGSATPGTDYTVSGASMNGASGTVIIPNGAGEATVTIAPTTSADAAETITLGLNADAAYGLGAQNQAVLTVQPYVTLSSEGSLSRAPTGASFVFTRSQPWAGPLTASFSLEGSADLGDDYTVDPSNVVLNGTNGTISFSPGAESARLTIFPVASKAAGATVSVRLKVDDADAPSYGVRGTSTTALSILPGVQVAAGLNPSLGPSDGSFVVSRGASRAGSLLVPFTLGGSATPGADYTVSGASVSGASGTVTIPNNAGTATITIVPTGGASADETIVLALGPDPAYGVSAQNQAELTMLPFVPTITVAAGGQASRAPTIGTFTFARGTTVAGDLPVKFRVDGDAQLNTDYTIAGGGVSISGANGQLTIPDGTTAITLTVSPVAGRRSGQALRLTVTSGPGYLVAAEPNASASLTIFPAVTLRAEGSPSRFGPVSGKLVVERDDTSGDLVVNLVAGGGARLGQDYTVSGATFNGAFGTVTIRNGQRSAEIRLEPATNAAPGSATFALLPGTGYGVGSRQSAGLGIDSAPPPRWLVLLYLAGDDVDPASGQDSLTPSLLALLNRLVSMEANPNMRLVLLFDGNQTGDSRIYTREANGLRDLTEEAAASPLWLSPFPGAAGQRELDTGDAATLQSFIRWARQSYPGSSNSMLSIVDHGGGWAADLGPPGQYGKDILQTGGARGLSIDRLSGNSLSTRNTRELLQGLGQYGQFDLIFFDACLMGMVESAYEVQPFTRFLIAGQNLLWSRLAYERYLAPDGLTASTDPAALAQLIVQRYNAPTPANEPFTVAALDMSTAKWTRLRAAIDGFARTLADTSEPIVRAAYSQSQKFDYDGSYDISPTEAYVDLAHFAQTLLDRGAPDDLAAAAREVVAAVGTPANGTGVVVAQRTVSGNYLGATPWNFDRATGLSIYLPLGERDCRPSGLPVQPGGSPTVAPCQAPSAQVGTPQIEPQLQRFYSQVDQLALTGDAGAWARLLLQLDPSTAARTLGPYRPIFPAESVIGERLHLPMLRR